MVESSSSMLGWLGAVMTIALHSLPVVSFYNLIRSKISYDDTPAYFATIGFCNSLLWFIYAKMLEFYEIKICASVCFYVCLLWILTYLIYEIRKELTEAILNILIVITGAIAIYRGFTIIIDDVDITGKTCLCLLIILHLSPCYMLYCLCKENNFGFKVFSWGSIVCNLIGSSAWIAYGSKNSNNIIFYGNFAGIASAFAQIIFWIVFKIKRRAQQIPQKIATDEGSVSKVEVVVSKESNTVLPEKIDDTEK